MRNDQREFKIFDLEVAARKPRASLPGMDKLIPLFQQWKDNNRFFQIEKGTSTLLISDIEHDTDKDYITLLIRRSNTLSSNSVDSNPAQGTFIEHVKKDGEGADFCCHVFISGIPEKNLPDTYACAIERVQGLSFTLIQRLLSHILHEEYTNNNSFFSYPHPGGGKDSNGEPRQERCCPHIKLSGRPSENLALDIENGTLQSISFIKTETCTPIGGAAYLESKSLEMRTVLDKNLLPQTSLFNNLTKVFYSHWQDTQYSKAKITYKPKNVSRPTTITIDMEKGTPLSERYILYFEIKNIDPLLAQSSKNIVPHLKNRAEEEFLKHRNI